MYYLNPYRKCVLYASLFAIALLVTKKDFAQNEKGRFNVLFIIVDDMNDKCSLLGHPQVLTPNIERLAKHGMVFTNAYSQYSLCNPSRTSVVTGWRPDGTKVWDNTTSPRSKLGPFVRFMPEYFHDNGYRTERYGKVMHSMFESECQWDYPVLTTKKLASSDDAVALDGDFSTDPGRWWISSTNDLFTTDARFCTQIDSSIKIKRSQPFFFGLGLQGTHAPFTPDIISWNMYGDNNKELMPIDSFGNKKTLMGNGSSNIALPNTPLNDLSDIPALEIQGSPILRKPDDEWKRAIHAYYAEVTQMDTQLGRVLDIIDEKHLWDNTVVVFLSDHGQFLGEHEGMWFKNRLLNEATHVPLIICAPGMPGGRCNQLVELVDVYPTLTDLCGIKRPKEYQGTSLVPLLVNPLRPWKPAIFSQVVRGTSFQLRSVITDQYQYCRLGTTYELYDRIKDPRQYTNLALDSAYSGIMTSMETIIDTGWRKCYPPVKDSIMYFFDGDKDGYGTISKYKFGDTILPVSYCRNVIDCNDHNNKVYPGAPEICDGIDNNCDGNIDEPGANISSADTISFCKGDSANLTCAGDSCYRYQWFKNGSTISNAKSKSLVVTDSGRYAICAYNALGDSVISNVVSVIINSRPPSVVTVSENTNICKGPVVLTAPSGSGLTYQWMKGTTNIAGATAQTYRPVTDGGYKLKVTNKFGCTSISAFAMVTNNCSFANTLGINSLYPNPAKNILYIQFNASETSAVSIILKNVAGVMFKRYTYNVVKGNNVISLNVNDIAPGNYLIEATDSFVSSNKMFVSSK